MQVSRFVVATSAALLSLASPSIAQALSLPGAREAEASPVRIHGLGGGTMILPGEGLGSVRALLVQESSESALLLEAQLVPYLFLAEHTPAGALSGGVYVPVDVESTDEPEQIAHVEGEWSVDEDGIGTLAAYLTVDDPSAGGSRIIGAVQGSFRVTLPEPPVRYAPPLTPPPPIFVPSSAISATPATSVVGIGLGSDSTAPAPLSAPAPTVAGVESTGAARSGEWAPVPPTVIVDPLQVTVVARIRLRWVMEL